MKIVKEIAILVVLCSAGCATAGPNVPDNPDGKHRPDVHASLDDISAPAPGTDTAVVQIFIDPRNGYPLVNEKIVLVKRGQRVVWVGPDKFAIQFPQGSPFGGKDEFSTGDAVISLVVPQRGKAKKQQENRPFKYNVIVDGKELDPHLIIIDQ